MRTWADRARHRSRFPPRGRGGTGRGGRSLQRSRRSFLPSRWFPRWPLQGLSDDLQHALGLVQDLLVPETHNPEPLVFQPPGALHSRGLLLRVVDTIHLDDEAAAQTDEIHDVPTYCVLTSERTAQLSATELQPQRSLGIGERSPEFPSTALDLPVDAHPTPPLSVCSRRTLVKLSHEAVIGPRGPKLPPHSDSPENARRPPLPVPPRPRGGNMH